jgi:hypothetical protein
MRCGSARLSDTELVRGGERAVIASLELVKMTRSCWIAQLSPGRQNLEPLMQFT